MSPTLVSSLAGLIIKLIEDRLVGVRNKLNFM